MDIPHLIGPCCYKTKLSAMLDEDDGQIRTHYFWSEGDLTLELLLPWFVGRFGDDELVCIDIILPTVDNNTLEGIKEMLTMRSDISVTMLCRDADDVRDRFVSMMYTNKQVCDKVRFLGVPHVTAQCVMMHSGVHSFTLTGQLPQRCAQSDCLLQLSTNASAVFAIIPYYTHLLKLAKR